MKRTPLARKTRLKVKGKSRFPKRRDAEYLAWIRTLPCLLRGKACWGSVEPAHVTSRGAGGDDVGNAVPLCTAHHYGQHTLGIRSFERKYGLDLAAEAQRLVLAHAGLAER